MDTELNLIPDQGTIIIEIRKATKNDLKFNDLDVK